MPHIITLDTLHIPVAEIENCCCSWQGAGLWIRPNFNWDVVGNAVNTIPNCRFVYNGTIDVDEDLLFLCSYGYGFKIIQILVI